jgi:hypothetical protein
MFSFEYHSLEHIVTIENNALNVRKNKIHINDYVSVW